jgi:hypothetical protein
MWFAKQSNLKRNSHTCVAALTDDVGRASVTDADLGAMYRKVPVLDNTEFVRRGSDKGVCLHVFLELNGPRDLVAAIIGPRDRAELNEDRAQARFDANVAGDLICERYIEVLGHQLGLDADVSKLVLLAVRQIIKSPGRHGGPPAVVDRW